MATEEGPMGSCGPAAREVFDQLDGQEFSTPEEFGEEFDTVVRNLGPMPRFWNVPEAIVIASHSGWLTVEQSGLIKVAIPDEQPPN